MPSIHVYMHEGRSVDQKRGLAEDITAAIGKNTGCVNQRKRIQIIFLELSNRIKIFQGKTKRVKNSMASITTWVLTMLFQSGAQCLRCLPRLLR